MAAKVLLSRVVSAILIRLAGGSQRGLLLRLLCGMSRESMQAIALGYARDALLNCSRREVVQEIIDRRNAGAKVYLASASIDVVVEAFSQLLNVDAYIATELDYKNGKCIGTIARDSTAVKFVRLQQDVTMGPEFDVITDNPEDVDLMAAATNTWFIEHDE